MQDFSKHKDDKKKVSFQDFSLEDGQKMVDVFAWLIEQDKKQNPALYQHNNS